LAFILSVVVAVTDATVGHRVVLIGLLIAASCCALLSGRWLPTALTGLWAIGLGVLLGMRRRHPRRAGCECAPGEPVGLGVGEPAGQERLPGWL
jgi:hypothetical protein